MKIHFLQSDTWKQFQKDLGRTIVEGKGRGWSYLGVVEKDRFGTYIYVPYGPFAESGESLVEAVKNLKIEAKRIGAYVIYIEPTLPVNLDYARKMFRHKGTHRQAHRTIRIDLTQDEDKIISDMNKTRRKQYRNYSKKGIVIEKSNTRETLGAFFKLLQLSSSQKKFYIRDKKFFETMFDKLVSIGAASLFVARQDGEIEVVALVYDDEDTRYYAHVGRDLSDNSLQATAPLISYMIIDAKHSGKKYFDLYGISERDDKIDEKSGFTVFKKTFGGEVVQYAGAWEVPVIKSRYYTKSALRSVKHSFQK